MLWGFFKKVVIADRLAMVVDRTFAHTNESSSLALFIGAVFYSFQIYCDFSGYSDIALGAARVMNIRLMENFKQPYLSRGIQEFWSKWHVSLSSWFRDYVYIPLGGNRKGGTVAEIQCVPCIPSKRGYGMALTGPLWYGDYCMGCLVILLTRKNKEGENRSRLYTTCSVIVTFILVTFLWIFFRSDNLAAAVGYIKAHMLVYGRFRLYRHKQS